MSHSRTESDVDSNKTGRIEWKCRVVRCEWGRRDRRETPGVQLQCALSFSNPRKPVAAAAAAIPAMTQPQPRPLQQTLTRAVSTDQRPTRQLGNQTRVSVREAILDPS